MAAPRWIFISFLVLLGLLGFCSSYRPLAAAKYDDNDGILSFSKNDDVQLQAVVMGTELCGDDCGHFEPKPPDCEGCGFGDQIRPPCEPPCSYGPPVEVEPCLPPLPPVILPPLPPPIEVEPCLPPLPPVILPVPPVAVLPPTDCPAPAPCSDGGICIDFQGKEYVENAMEPAPKSVLTP